MKRILAVVLFIAIQITSVVIPATWANASQPSKKTQIVLTVKGDGVVKRTQFTLKQLQAMQKGTVSVAYSSVNSLPTGKFFVGKGVTMKYLLQKSGIRSSAKSVTFRASDGYERKIALARLNSPLYYFPNVMDDSAVGKVTVPAILAWEQAENTNDLHKIKAGQLRFMLGQTAPSEATASDFVKYVYEIEVSKK